MKLEITANKHKKSEIIGTVTKQCHGYKYELPQETCRHKQEVNRPSLPLVDRRGKLKYFSQFDDYLENHNICIVGSDGSGKGVLIQEMMRSTLSGGGKVSAIVADRSFSNFCQESGGSYIEFNLNNPVSVNPFLAVPTGNDMLSVETRKNFLENFSITLATMALPENETDDLQDKILLKALQKCWDKANVNTTIDDIVDWLSAQKNNIIANDLAKMLFSYTKNGDYGGFFSGNAGVFNNNLVVIDLSDLRSDKGLYAVVIQTILHCESLRRQAADSNSYNLCAIERFEDMPKCPKTLTVLHRIMLTAKKFRGSIILAAESRGFTDSLALSIFDRASVKIIMWLSMCETSRIPEIPLLQRYFHNNKELVRTAESLKVKKDEYSEFMVWGAGFNADVCRLRKDLVALFLNGDNSRFKQVIKDLTEQDGKYLKVTEINIGGRY